MYIIYNPKLNKYWNRKKQEWSDRAHATVYGDMERFRTTMPVGGQWEQW